MTYKERKVEVLQQARRAIQGHPISTMRNNLIWHLSLLIREVEEHDKEDEKEDFPGNSCVKS